ncbi:MAG: PAC2 family protein [Acidimicrobiia bacterium]|nr:PAC2 family protein [Acidimicrobiia bacterium]
MIAAFEGWNDAGEAATAAVRTLVGTWNADPFVEIDPEEFYDFTATRPMVRLVEGRTRQLDWPANVFSAAPLDAIDNDAILLLGTEPGLKWRTFCEQVVEVVRETDARMVVTLGALLAEVPHTRPVRVIGTAEDDELIRRLRLRRSGYEGPTGIVGVLHDALRRRGVPSVSLWATVPTYVSGPSSPVAALALLRRVGELLGADVANADLEQEAVDYRRRIDEVVDDDEDLRDFLQRLEAAYDEDVVEDTDPAELIAELERFLREQ